jgi:hypothetical protein
MRMFFEPEDVESYEAATELLIRRAGLWAREHDLVLDPFVLSAAMDFRHQSLDGRLGRWTTALVQEFLLDWMPRKISARATELAAAPEALRTFVRYLRAVELDDPTGAPLPELEAAITDAAGRFPAAMSDERTFGLAKFWAMTAMAAGVDVTDGAAMQRFTLDVRNGRVEYDEDVLNEIVRRSSLRDGSPERELPQLPVSLPPDEELADHAQTSQVVQQLRTLVDWVGTGRPLTAKGQVKLADARELVPLLGTGDVIDPRIGGRTFHTTSSAELGSLSLLVEWAKKARLVRVVKNRLVTVAKSKPLLSDSLALWLRAFDTITDLADVLFPQGYGRHSMFAAVLDDALPDILNAVYGIPEPLPVIRLEEPAWLMCLDNFVVEGPGQELWRMSVQRDVRRTLEVLAALGAVELTTGIPDPMFSLDLEPVPHDEADPFSTSALPPDSQQRIRAALAPGSGDIQLVHLTALGTYAVRNRLLTEGRTAPLVGELSDATGAQLLGTVAEHYGPDTGRDEIDRWLAANHADLDQLLDSVRRCAFRSRAAAMLDVLVASQPDGDNLIRQLRTDPLLGSIAIHHLVGAEQLSMDDLSPSEALTGMAEQFLLLLEVGGPDSVRAALAEVPDLPEFAHAIINSGHPDTDGLTELRTLVIEPTLKATRRGLHSISSGSHHPKRKRPTNKRKRKR